MSPRKSSASKNTGLERLIFVQNGFFAEFGHWMHELRAWKEAARHRGMQWHGMANRSLPSAVALREEVDPCFPYIPGQTRRGMHAEARLEAFLYAYEITPKILAKHYPGTPSRRDLLYIANATDSEMIGMARWLEEIPKTRHPSVVFAFHHPSHEWRTDSSGLKILGDSHRWHYAARRLKECSDRVRYVAALPALAQEMSRLLEVKVDHVFHYARIMEDAPESGIGPSYDLGFLGMARTEQGEMIRPAVISALLQLGQNPKILIQSSPGQKAQSQKSALRKIISNAPGLVSILPHEKANSDFLKYLSACRIQILPYQPEIYGLRCSGVFQDSICLGIPVVAHSRSSMGRMILAGIAAGVTYDNHDPEAIAFAALRALRTGEELRHRAMKLRKWWRSELSASSLLNRICMLCLPEERV